MTKTEAEGQLDDWRRNFERRDLLVRAAKDAGMSISEIAVRSGITRPTVYGILGLKKAGK